MGLAVKQALATLNKQPNQLMEALSQLDVQSPDHVSVITRDGKVTISVVKDGTSVTLGFPLKNQITSTNPPFPLQQQVPPNVGMKTQETTGGQPRPKPLGAPGTTHIRYNGYTPKLTPSDVRDIKAMVNDADIIGKYSSKTRAYEEIGKAYGVTGCAIGNIARGIAWRNITV